VGILKKRAQATQASPLEPGTLRIHDMPIETAMHDDGFYVSGVEGISIGWDTCGECARHWKVCTCKAGASMPKWARAFTKNDDPYNLNGDGSMRMAWEDPEGLASVDDVIKAQAARKAPKKGKPVRKSGKVIPFPQQATQGRQYPSGSVRPVSESGPMVDSRSATRDIDNMDIGALNKAAADEAAEAIERMSGGGTAKKPIKRSADVQPGKKPLKKKAKR
jgi:hypothetical protein